MSLEGLQDQNEVLQKDWDQMAKIAITFFSHLFTSRGTATEQEMEEVLDKVPIRVDVEDRGKLNAP